MEGRPTVTDPFAAETSTSFAVPVSDVTATFDRSEICEPVIEIVVLLAAVRRPWASTVKLATEFATP